MKRIFKGPWLWIVLAVVGVLIALQFLAPSGGYDEIETSKMESYIASGEVKEITFVDAGPADQGDPRTNGDKVTSFWLDGTQEAIQRRGPEAGRRGQRSRSTPSRSPKPSLLGSILATLLPFALIILLFLFLMNQVQGGGGRGVMQFAKSKAKLITKDMPKTTFADVAGCDEAIEELGEIKEFLQEPAKFQAVGAKIPKGVLLYGPPGTGKTLLARAVAGEAGVPFYSISGSDFVEMFVGVGASRVRDLFEQAKENAPAIVFIDEIDAVGRHRGAGMGGGHDEREQTLNQLLVEMDGFDVRGGVILIAATNRPDVLDPALLRPGRFDRQIAVDAPDLAGRHQILQVHSRGKPMAPDVDLLVGRPSYARLHRRRPGQRAQRGRAAHRARQPEADHQRGPRRGDRPRHRRPAAAHPPDEREGEADHGLPRGRPRPGRRGAARAPTRCTRSRSCRAAARSATRWCCPTRTSTPRPAREMLDKLAYMLGGRAAEEMVFHDPTTGAGNDIEKATSLARAMVTQYGMTEPLGAIKLGDANSEPFLGRDMGHQRNYSEDVAAMVDEETKKLLADRPPGGLRHPRGEPRRPRRRWCSSCSTRRRSTRSRSPRIFEPLRRRPERPGVDRLRPTATRRAIPPVEIPQ